MDLELVGIEENRGVNVIRRLGGETERLEPLAGSETHILLLKLPGGETIRAQVGHEEFEEKFHPELLRAATRAATRATTPKSAFERL
jgi:hypothetical protein